MIQINAVFAGTRLRQPAIRDSRGVAAEWGDDPLDADGDTKRLSRLEVGGANPPRRRAVNQQERPAKATPHFLFAEIA